MPPSLRRRKFGEKALISPGSGTARTRWSLQVLPPSAEVLATMRAGKKSESPSPLVNSIQASSSLPSLSSTRVPSELRTYLSSALATVRMSGSAAAVGSAAARRATIRNKVRDIVFLGDEEVGLAQ